jgi:hypothetical protein
MHCSQPWGICRLELRKGNGRSCYATKHSQPVVKAWVDHVLLLRCAPLQAFLCLGTTQKTVAQTQWQCMWQTPQQPARATLAQLRWAAALRPLGVPKHFIAADRLCMATTQHAAVTTTWQTLISNGKPHCCRLVADFRGLLHQIWPKVVFSESAPFECIKSLITIFVFVIEGPISLRARHRANQFSRGACPDYQGHVTNNFVH